MGPLVLRECQPIPLGVDRQLSPDGATVAVNRLDRQTGFSDIWVHHLAGDTSSRLTFGPRFNESPIWSPDGSHIAFSSHRTGDFNLIQKATTGAAQEEVLDKDTGSKHPNDWSRDGRYIIEQREGDPKTGFDVWVLPLFGDRKPFPYLQSEFNERTAKLSPNGQWLAYASDEGKRSEIYVQTFPTPGGKRLISTNGGSLPVWSRDGKELFYIGGDRKMMAVEVKGGSKFATGAPKALFETHVGENDSSFDVSNDPRRNKTMLVPLSGSRSGACTRIFRPPSSVLRSLTSLAIIAMNSFSGLSGQLRYAPVDWQLTAGFTVLALAGMLIGLALSSRASEPALRRAFAVLLLIVAVTVAGLVLF